MHIQAEEEDQLPAADIYGEDMTITEYPDQGAFQDAPTDQNLTAEKASPITTLENKESIDKYLTNKAQSFNTMLGKVHALPNGEVPTKKQAISLFKDLLQHQKALQEHKDSQGAILHQEKVANWFGEDNFQTL